MLRDSPLQILLVEDNSGDSRLLQEMLHETVGVAYELRRVVKLRDARRHLERARPGIIRLDLGLPDEQGLQTLELQMVDLLAHQSDGTIRVDRGAGTAFTITCAAKGRAVSDGGGR